MLSGSTSTRVNCLLLSLSAYHICCNFAAGDDITCTVVITNAGKDWLTGVDLLGQANCSYLLLLPGSTVTCMVTSTLTQLDLDRFDSYGTFKPITAHAVAYSLSNTSHLIGDQQTVDLPLPVYTGLDLQCEADPILVTTAGRQTDFLCLMQRAMGSLASLPAAIPAAASVVAGRLRRPDCRSRQLLQMIFQPARFWFHHVSRSGLSVVELLDVEEANASMIALHPRQNSSSR